MNIPPKGTHDLYGETLEKTKKLIQILTTHAQRWSFEEIQTPVFEYAQTFNNNNIDTDLSNKELFYLSENKYVLRPENTASIVRAVISNKLQHKQALPLQFFYCGKMYRYERPQEGRYREFTQFGLEKIGAQSYRHDLELIDWVTQLIKQLKLEKHLTLKINYLADHKTKQAWNNKLKTYFKSYESDLSEDSKKRINTNPLRILDDKVDSKLQCVINAPKIEEFLSLEKQEEITKIKDHLHSINISFDWDQNLVRGIDYYTGLVFEWTTPSSTIIAGGRYDELFTKFNEPNLPSVGLAIGTDRLINLLNQSSYDWCIPNTTKIYIANIADNYCPLFNNLLTALRESGLIIVTNPDLTTLKEHFKQSSKTSSDFLIIYGQNEKINQQFVFKQQNTKEQTVFSLASFSSVVATEESNQTISSILSSISSSLPQ